jgi:hypothetical protein
MDHHASHARTSSWLLALLLAIPGAAAPSRSIAQSATPSAAPDPSGDPISTQPEDAPPVKKKPAADVRAYHAARVLEDPQQRIAALRAFLHDYPKSDYLGHAQDALFTTLLEHFPDRTADIEALAKSLIKQSGKGAGAAREESYLAWLMANAGPSGADLPYAEKLAAHVVTHLTEPAFNAYTVSRYAKFKIAAPKPAELHAEFAETRGEALAALAAVYLLQGKQPQTDKLVGEAYSLAPKVDDVNSVRGRLALANHNDALALESFEAAQLLGAVTATDRTKMMDLYRQSHSGSEAGFDEEMDARYAKLFPAPLAPAKPNPVSGGHTVLLELFTGSACGPCIGGDLAVDGLLDTYPRSEIVALAFDQHIPDPDPLTNPDSAARADFYDVAHTPSYVLDGKQQPIYGSDREGSRNLYDSLAKWIDAEAARPTGIELKLAASQGPGGIVQAHATVTLPAQADILKALTPAPQAPDPSKPTSGQQPAVKPAPKVEEVPTDSRLILNFALVEDDVRYSGENGIRFHRMVVRALSKPAYTGFHVEPGGTATLDASFNLAAVSASLVSYLDTYEQKNEKFGKIKFLTKDMTMQPSHLAIAAWVQSPSTHRVLQAALIPVTGETTLLKGAE